MDSIYCADKGRETVATLVDVVVDGSVVGVVVADSVVNEVVAKHDDVSQTCSDTLMDTAHLAEFIHPLDYILTPAQITEVSKKLTVGKGYVSKCFTGFYLSKLVLNSYAKGNNNFELDLEDKPRIWYPGTDVYGEEQPLIVNIEGKVVSAFANVENIIGTIKGDVVIRPGCFAKNSDITIDANHVAYCGDNASGTTFFFKGETEVLSRMGDLSYVDDKKSAHNTFVTDNKYTLQQLIDNVNYGNIIAFYEKEGTKIIRNFCQTK
ncbi:hypothetical protein HQ545_01650 [Candidatus Woesearchaeota archaeon]|nr:hypothetical protein [Candidatus Woesearchaeota archaeon]